MHASSSTEKIRAAREGGLKAEIAELQAALGEAYDAEKIVNHHIKLLHDYNEAKDASQIIIGKLAVHKEMTVKQLHEDYGLSSDD